MTDPQIGMMMLGLFIFIIMLGFPIAFTLVAMGVGFGYYAYYDATQDFFANRVFTLLANLAFYGNMSDSLSSYRAIKRKRLSEVRVDGRGHAAHYQLSIMALKRGWKVAEMPTVELVNPDANAREQVLLNAFPVLMVLVKEWARQKGGHHI
ncbi:MAG: hypothetical protein C4576_06745 [Desulfobacteraceae bacterium]|nr:MAG: hypothetical protein C4576_06745 [Desulfobacteraceae bacterium]